MGVVLVDALFTHLPIGTIRVAMLPKYNLAFYCG